MKKITALVVSAVLILSLAGCGGSAPTAQAASSSQGGASSAAPAKAVEISLATSGAIDASTLMGQVMLKAPDRLEALSNGALTLKFYDNGQLGGDAEILEGVKMGSVGIHVGSSSTLVTLIPELNILDISGLFTSTEAFNEVFSADGKFFPTIQKYYNDQGLQLLCIYAATFRQMAASKPVNSIADLKGIKIRTMENAYHMAYWQALGANPTPLAFSELYIALQQGTCAAAEGPLNTSIVPSRLYEVQNNLIMTNHIPSVMVTTMNKAIWDSLGAENQQALQTVFNEMTAEVVAGQADDDVKLLKVCEDNGMNIIYPNEAFKAELRQAADVVIDSMKKELDPAFIDEFIAAVDAAESK